MHICLRTSGSSVSDTATVGAIRIPEMHKEGYTLEYASGLTVVSSTMGMIIPPSVPMVLYAMVAEKSVGKLFLAGAIPGIMIGLTMLSIAFAISYIKKHLREEKVLTGKGKLITIERSVLELIMPFLAANLVTLVAITFIPQLTLWLPSLLM